MSIAAEMSQLAGRAKTASRKLATLRSGTKNAALLAMAEGIEKAKAHLQSENQKDVAAAEQKGLASAMVDRLRLTDKVIAQMAQGLREVAALPDPVGSVSGMWVRPNGLKVGKMRIPLGVVCIVYESRPNVTVDAAGLCLKAGNSVILRGGSEAIYSNLALAEILQKALSVSQIPSDAIQVVQTTDRQAVLELLKLEQYVDLAIPRGGEGLIRFVAENSRVPVIKHYKGVCHTYVDKDADLEMGVKLAVNGKAQRPGVCNATETLLIHKDVSKDFVPKVGKALREAGVELRVCPVTAKLLGEIPHKAATEDDYYAEFLDLILAVRTVDSFDDAVAHIQKYGSDHTETIVTQNYSTAQRFLETVTSSCVFVNASTRFSDGFELGLGAEIGISTSKIHAYGPMGLEGLTTEKFIVYGDGQARG
ncbi:MAG: glutamate-5-semialdehyde dehydrogenase [Bdellovibrionota bacterium]